MNGRSGQWKNILIKNALSILIAVAFLSALWGLAHVVVENELYVPSLSESVKQMGEILSKNSFWGAFFSTLSRVLSAFVVSFILAVLVAIISYMVPWFGGVVAPIVSALRSLPTLAILLLVLVWTNAGVAPIIVAFLSLFPMLEAGMYAALCQTDKGLIEMSRIYGVPLKKRILQLYLPAAAPYALREMGAALAFSLKLVVSAEILAATNFSLGGMMQEARLYLEMPRLFALVTISFFVGLLLELLANAVAYFVERRVK